MSRQSENIDEFFTTDRVVGREGSIELPEGSYREYLYDLDHEVLAPYREMDYEEFTADRYQAPFLQQLLQTWEGMYEEPFVGMTVDGTVRPDLYSVFPDGSPSDSGESAGDRDIVAAAQCCLDSLDEEERGAVQYPLDAPQWRAWSNPEFVIHRVGLRLENLSADKVEAILAVVQASLSEQGYARVREAMDLNGFLGDITQLRNILNEQSYWFAIYGEPSTGEPWGWQLFGHHVAVHFVMVGGRHVIAPVFLGAEPALSDGQREPLFDTREEVALALAGSLTAAQRKRAVVYESVLDPAMPEGRVHPADERHVAGAFQDNRIVPYEGISASDLDDAQREQLRELAADALSLLIEEQRERALANFDKHLGETHFSWYGSTDGSGPFYCRIHSPVLFTELDHHAGVWLSNRLPARFHIHTTLRLPNGNDYGKAYIRQWREARVDD